MPNAENDSRLEQFSREAADRYNVPGIPAWEKMEQELDRVLPVQDKKRRRLLFWWLIPTLLVAGWATWFFTQSNNPTNQQAFSKPAPANSTQPAATIAPLNETVEAPKQAPIPTLTTDNSTFQKENATTPSNVQKRLEINNSSIKAISKTDQTSPQAKVTAVIDNRSSKEASQATSNQTDHVNTTLNMLQSSPTKEEVAANTNIQQREDSLAQETNKTADTTQINQDNTTNSLPTTKSDKTTLSKRGKGWSIAVLGGIDHSTVKFKYGNGSSYETGIILGYHFNEALSLHTGALYTRKNYKMAGEDFHAPKGSWINNYKLETVDGFCRMWEIPLFLRYGFSNRHRNQFFFSTGLSSYLMQQENYNYHYYYNGTLVKRNVNYDNSSTYLLSILQLSAGMEKRLSNSLSVLIEPFAKLPLRGLGQGSVQLSSYGMHFSLQYRQPRRK